MTTLTRSRARQTRPVFGFSPTDDTAAAITATVLRRPDAVNLVVTPNLDHVARLRRCAAFRAAYRSAAIVLCDGAPVHLYARLRGMAARRVTGCDLAIALLAPDRIIPLEARLFFAVDTADTAGAVRTWAARRGLGDRVATAVPPRGFAAPGAAQNALRDAIARHGTTLLVMAVGAPQSEVFVDRARAGLPPLWAICIGQAVKVALGLTRRAPPAARDLGLEWAWRLWQEPRRLARRYGLGAFDFALAVTEDLLDRGEALLGPEM